MVGPLLFMSLTNTNFTTYYIEARRLRFQHKMVRRVSETAGLTLAGGSEAIG